MLSALPEFIQRSFTINARQEMESFEEICRLIKAGKSFSTWVEKRWKEMALKSQAYSFCERIDDEHWKVLKSTSVRCTVHSVYIPAVPRDGDDVPTCSCPTFSSSWLPCAAMCRAFADVERPMFDQCNLKWRWRLCSHPLFERAARKLIPGYNLSVDTEFTNDGRAVDVDTEVDDIGATMQAYASMKVPASSHTRYKALMDIAKALAAEGSIDAASYKSALFDLIAAQNKLKNLALVSLDDKACRPPSATQPVAIRPPLTRHPLKGRKRVSADELMNKGGLRGDKKKKALTSSCSTRRTIRCSVCHAMNRDGRGHRRGSKKCPTVISYNSEAKAHAKEASEKEKQQLNEGAMQLSEQKLKQHLEEAQLQLSEKQLLPNLDETPILQSSEQHWKQQQLDESHMQPCEKQNQGQSLKKSQRRCSLCRKNGVIATNHQKGSKCPFFQMPKSVKAVAPSLSDSSSSLSDFSDSTTDSIPLVQLARSRNLQQIE